MLKEFNIEFQYTCMEMRNSEHNNCGCGPEDLVRLTRDSAWRFNIPYSGENALPTGSDNGYNTIIAQSKYNGRKINGFTYLRMFDWLFENDNFNRFRNFISRMRNL